MRASSTSSAHRSSSRLVEARSPMCSSSSPAPTRQRWSLVSDRCSRTSDGSARRLSSFTTRPVGACSGSRRRGEAMPPGCLFSEPCSPHEWSHAFASPRATRPSALTTRTTSRAAARSTTSLSWMTSFTESREHGRVDNGLGGHPLRDSERNELPLVDYAVADRVQRDPRRKTQSVRIRRSNDRRREVEPRALPVDLVYHLLGRMQVAAQGEEVVPRAKNREHVTRIGNGMSIDGPPPHRDQRWRRRSVHVAVEFFQRRQERNVVKGDNRHR